MQNKILSCFYATFYSIVLLCITPFLLLNRFLPLFSTNKDDGKDDGNGLCGKPAPLSPKPIHTLSYAESLPQEIYEN